MGYDSHEPGDSPLFTWQSSVAPDAAPTFSVARVDESGVTGVFTMTAIQSDATHYYAIFTMPVAEQEMRLTWFAQKTVSGSTWNVVKRQPFLVRETMR